ncbi:hypothetical protein V8J83_09710 [Gymnodinialimonas sp. 2307UL20-7]
MFVLCGIILRRLFFIMNVIGSRLEAPVDRIFIFIPPNEGFLVRPLPERQLEARTIQLGLGVASHAHVVATHDLADEFRSTPLCLVTRATAALAVEGSLRTPQLAFFLPLPKGLTAQ